MHLISIFKTKRNKFNLNIFIGSLLNIFKYLCSIYSKPHSGEPISFKNLSLVEFFAVKISLPAEVLLDNELGLLSGRVQFRPRVGFIVSL